MALTRQALFQGFERSKQCGLGMVVGRLAAGKPTAINAVIGLQLLRPLLNASAAAVPNPWLNRANG